MNKEQKTAYRQETTKAVFSCGLIGVEIKAIEFGIDDYIIYQDTDDTIHRAKIYYIAESPYFVWRRGNMRVYLNECIRSFNIL